jgi:hypothetical protein
MYDKLLALWLKVQPLVDKAYAWSPFLMGIAVGYLAHPFIKLALDLLLKLL